MLKAAGWFERRHTPTDRYQHAFLGSGLNPPPGLLSFLSEFGGLTLRFQHARVPTSTDWCTFDPLRAIENTDMAWVRDYAARVGDDLWPIGDCYHDHMIFSMAASGRVYGGFDQCLVLVGESGDDAVDALCIGRDPTPVPLP